MKTFGNILDSLNSITEFYSGKMQFRDGEEYGDITFSVQASHAHYCEPRVDGLPIDQYETVEVGFLVKGQLSLPSKAGIGGFDHLFEEGMSSPVAGYVSQSDVRELRNAIIAHVKAGA